MKAISSIEEDQKTYDIEIFDLTKTYKIKGKNTTIKALDEINLKIKKGEILGLLGPNGAGKTTMISILTTLIQPTSGTATILGRDIIKDAWFIRENVGLMLGGDMIYHRLTGYKNLKFYSMLYGIKNYREKIEQLAEFFNLKNWLNEYVSNYSRGMQIKLSLARVLLIEPKILFLDEPTLGLDPPSAKEIIKILRGLNKTIFLTSHQMEIVSRLCNKIAFLNKGKIIKVDTQDNLKKLISNDIRIKIRVAKNSADFIKSLKDLDYVNDIKNVKNSIFFKIKNENFYPNLFDFLRSYPIILFNEKRPTLEDIFIKLSK